MRRAIRLLPCLWLAIGAHAACAEQRDFCADRPGQTTPPCTLAPGSFMVETAAVGWSVSADPDQRTDSVTFASSVLRAGLTQRLEAQIGWTPYGVVRNRDRTTGLLTRQGGTGDVSLGLIYGLAGANGPLAIQAAITLPTGSSALGAGDWSAQLRLPAVVSLGSGVQLAITPEVDAAANDSGKGRHLSYGGATGVGIPLTEKLGLGLDVSVFRNDEPTGAVTLASAGASLAWQMSANTQLDVGGTAGLNANSPNVGVYFGIAHRF